MGIKEINFSDDKQYEDSRLDNENNYWKNRKKLSDSGIKECIPSFRESKIAQARYRDFVKMMQGSGLTTMLMYGQWCELWENSGLLADMKDYKVVPSCPCTAIDKDNAIIVANEHVATHMENACAYR
jgi:hypothetical protein